MRKLILSLGVVALSGAYVATVAASRDGGVQSLFDRLAFRPAGDPALLEPADPLLGSGQDAAPQEPEPGPRAALEATSVSAIGVLPPVPVPVPLPVPAPLPPALAPVLPVPVAPPSKFHDGAYTGSRTDAYFGMVQVRAHVEGGKLASVEVLTYPADRRTSRSINSYALPLLEREVVHAQGADVDIVSGATLTAVAYLRSLDVALRQAE